MGKLFNGILSVSLVLIILIIQSSCGGRNEVRQILSAFKGKAVRSLWAIL